MFLFCFLFFIHWYARFRPVGLLGSSQSWYRFFIGNYVWLSWRGLFFEFIISVPNSKHTKNDKNKTATFTTHLFSTKYQINISTSYIYMCIFSFQIRISNTNAQRTYCFQIFWYFIELHKIQSSILHNLSRIQYRMQLVVHV